MISLVIYWIVITMAILIAAFILPGIRVRSLGAALAAAAVLGLLNMFIKPILIFLTLPITVLTLGLFVIVINALLLMLAGAIVRGLEIKSFWWAVAGAVIVSIVTSVLHSARL
ncbi:MAG: phage holin family protein [Desulfomonile sp.]|nr:phage holin family protein [Desulfomonile sp.]